MMIFFALSCLFIGFLHGATSIGGILLVPAMMYSAGMALQTASGTAVLCLFFMAAVATWLHWKSGNLVKTLVKPQCMGALVFGCVGALTKNLLGDVALTVILAVFIIISGIAVFRPVKSADNRLSTQGQFLYLLFVGSFAGFMAGLAGMGGPVLSVPMMIVMGFPPLATVAAAQPFQMAACFSGSVGNIFLGQIDWPFAFFSILMLCIGVWTGVHVGKHMDTTLLKKCIAVLCILTGIIMLFK